MDDRPLSADRVPTLTEVIELNLPPPPAAPEPEATVVAAEAVTLDIGPPLVVEAQPEVLPVAVDAEPAAVEITEPAAVPEEQTADVARAVSAPEPEPEPLPPSAADPIVVAEPEPVAHPAEAVEPTVAAVPVVLAAPVDTDALVAQVLAELQPRVDMLLESRLREALAPALARVADGLIRDTRDGLSAALRELVHETVDRALQRRADR